MRHPAKDCIITAIDNEAAEEFQDLHIQLADDIENDFKKVANRMPFGAFARDSSGNLRGGIKGYSHWNWLYLSHLWVQPEFRFGGLGVQLLLHAEFEAKHRKLSGIYVDTFSEKALKFYIRQGYVENSRTPDFPPGHTRHGLIKRL